MRKYIIGFFILIAQYSYSQSGEKYVEIAEDNRIKFYFDEQYYLLDKNCEFLKVTRISAFNKQKNIFDGVFTDYNPDGQIVLTGNYSDGNKEGIFKSFYPNGFLKWEGSYQLNNATGLWYFYYPDGKPDKIVERKDGQIRIMHAWNEKGKQVIKNGDGKFALDDYLPGFNSIGYNGISYSGKLKNGLPDGLWSTEYISPKNKRERFYTETYRDGRLITSFIPHKNSGTRLLPTEYFVNAENLTSKNCTIDDNAGFTIYLGEKLNDVFKLVPVAAEDLVNPFEISLRINEKGESSDIKINPQLQTDVYKLLYKILADIPFWIPSQIDGKLITDTLTIRTAVLPKQKSGPSFSLPVFSRLKGK